MSQGSVPAHHRIAEKIARIGRERGALAHSLLIYGPTGSGLPEVAHKFGQSVFCETGEGPFGACGSCRNCRRILEGTHPDWIWMKPEREGRGLPNISIEALRNLQDRMVLEPYEGPRVVGAICEAEKMRPEAANSLLKLVEEPPSHALFILVTDNRQRILPTIRSRCLPIPLAPPNVETVADDLVDRFGWDRDLAEDAAVLSLREGVSPEEAVSEEAREIREEAADLLGSAINRGEYDYIPALKGKKYDRDTQITLLRSMRECLLQILILGEGGNQSFVTHEFEERFRSWSERLDTTDLADLIDLSVDYEEAILGYVNPTHTLISFLSEVSLRFNRGAKTLR